MAGLLERIGRARRSARAAGVAVELALLHGVTHNFIKIGRALKAAPRALDAAAVALKRACES